MFFGKDSKKKEFARIYDHHVEQIYRFVVLKVGSKETAEDITSRVFTRIWEYMKNEENPDLENPRAYLYRLARNAVIDHYRKKELDSVAAPEDLPLADGSRGIDEEAAERSEMKRIREALQALNEDYQNVIVWYYLDELSAEEIAELLGKSENAVRVTVHRALRALRKEMERRGV